MCEQFGDHYLEDWIDASNENTHTITHQTGTTTTNDICNKILCTSVLESMVLVIIIMICKHLIARRHGYYMIQHSTIHYLPTL